MSIDHFAPLKAQVQANIDSAKASEHPHLTLRKLEQGAMDTWGPVVSELRKVLEMINALRVRAGVEPEPIEFDALSFPNWVIAQIRKARRVRGWTIPLRRWRPVAFGCPKAIRA